jgi:cell division cycle 14
MRDEKYSKTVIFHHCTPTFQKQANAAFLMCAYLVVCERFSAEEAWSLFERFSTTFVPFCDSGETPFKDFELTILDTLRGLERAVELGWYDFKSFDHKEYEKNHKLENGDMNWVIPNQILALSSPSDKGDGITAKDFVSKFKRLEVSTVIRLNESLYNERLFFESGIKVMNQEYLDGSCPDDSVISNFIKTCYAELGMGNRIAVHCRAGLGRTGTLIGCYIMHKYGFKAESLIGWLRLARPGSVIGIQQTFLIDAERRIKSFRIAEPVPKSVV